MAAELPPLVARVFCYKALSSALRALGGGALLEEGGVLPIADEVAAAVAVACAVAALATPLDVLRTRTLQILLADNEERIQDGAPSEAAAADPTGIKRAAAELAEAARRDGTAVLFAGTAPRVLWNGCVVGATTPLRSVGFGWVRDGVILQLFDSAAGAARDDRVRLTCPLGSRTVFCAVHVRAAAAQASGDLARNGLLLRRAALAARRSAVTAMRDSACRRLLAHAAHGAIADG